jgi:hypothetical protein
VGQRQLEEEARHAQLVFTRTLPGEQTSLYMGRLLVKFPSRNICEENPMTATLNGNVRKSLAEQIDRLDGILDGLADSLSGVIADAVRDTVGPAVKEAVQAVLIDVLGNPKVLEKLRGPAPAQVSETPKRIFIARLTVLGAQSLPATAQMATNWSKP